VLGAVGGDGGGWAPMDDWGGGGRVIYVTETRVGIWREVSDEYAVCGVGIEKGQELELEDDRMGAYPLRKGAGRGGFKFPFKKGVANVELRHLSTFMP